MSADMVLRPGGLLAEVDHVTYAYPGREQPALNDVTMRLSVGEVVLVLGESGSGKSTLLRALNGLVPHFHGGAFAGRVVTAGHDTRTTPARDLAGLAGLVFQDPENQAVMTTVEREIAFGLENLGHDPMTVSRLVEESLIALGLSRLRRADLSTLSGGELQKVALAAVLSMQPQLLLLDEPTSQLDPVSSEDLLAAVRRLAEDTGTTIVLAEHRVERCLSLATRVLYMEAGTIVIDSTPQEFARWAAAHREDLLPPVARPFARRGQSGHGEQVDEAQDRDGLLPLTVKEGRRLLSELSPVWVPALAPSVTTLAQRPARADVPAVVEVKRLTAGYPPDPPVLDGIDLALHPGDLVALMGENGCGKSTLVRHLNGSARPLEGRVRLQGRDVAELSVAEAARSCAVLGQDPGAYFVRDTVAEELDYSFDVLEVRAAERMPLLERITRELDLTDLMRRDPRELSGGERTRVALAIVACGDPAIVVLDEPTRGMDQGHKFALAALLREWARGGRAVVVVTHDVEFAARVSARVVILGDGSVLADGPSRQVLSGSLFFSTQIDRLLRHACPGALVEDDVAWREGPAARQPSPEQAKARELSS